MSKGNLNSNPLLEEAPQALREEVDNYEAVLPAVLGPKMADVELGITMEYLRGATAFQEGLRILNGKGEVESKWFKGTITEVEMVERRGGSGFLLGRKAKVIFEDPRSGKEQDIMTGWVEYNSRWGIPHWELAQSRSVMNLAKRLIGKEAVMRKSFIYGVSTAEGGDKVRFLADIRPGKDVELDDPEPLDQEDDGDQVVEEQDIVDLMQEYTDYDITDDDVSMVQEVASMDHQDIIDSISDYLGVEPDDLDMPKKRDYQENWELAALLIALNA